MALVFVLCGSAFAAQAQVVISQVYGGGGNASAPFNRDFIELHNNGVATVSVAGWSVQYASSAGTTWAATALTGTIPAGGYYIVHQASGGAIGAALPTADATGTINMSGTNGKVALVNSTTLLTGTCPIGNVDFVGYGSANCSETAPTGVLSNTTAAIRANGGCTDNGNNSTDFAVAAPSPRNSASAGFACGAGLPSLSIADLTLNEGDTGTQTATFTVQLSSPAGAGGVTFDIATADGSATALGSDYVANVLTAQTIPAGFSTYTFNVTVNGDTVVEPNENFLVNVTNVSGATTSDGQASATITNDDSPAVPTLSIADLTIDEGDTGTKTAIFTVQLSGAAPVGGVTFDIATADDTATTAGSDYLARALTGQTIPSGSSTYTFDVTVNGDTAVESNESFLVNVTNVSGATIGDGQARATIVNDDFNITPIHDIQGAGATSPIVGQTVTTLGIVTGRKGNGFFLQTADGEADANTATSQGIFVFTSTTPPLQATVGNRVRVSGTVVEFIPSQDPLQLPLTEISNTTAIIELSTGNAMPTPVQLTTTFPDPANPALDQLEPVEGMRVTAASFTVVAPTRGSTNEPNATGSSNGQINLVVTGVARPVREPGIPNPDPAPVPGGGSFPPLPRWDFNPELMFSDTDGIGAPKLDLAAGATLTNYVGPMDYGFRRYSIYPDPAITPVIVQPSLTAARLPTADEFTVAAYNLERFFDTVSDGTGEPVLTATAYANRLNKASLGIRNFLNTPDILGIVEVEKLPVLQDLANKISADAIASSQGDPQYVPYLQEGNDVGGIDVGFLVKSAEVAAGIDRVEVLAVTQQGKTTVLTNPDSSTSLLNDRPPLQLDALVHFADGRKFPITVFVVHQRSLSGATGNDANGERIRNKRQKQAEYLAGLVEGMQTADPDRRITLVGDFNAFEFNDGLVDAMNVVTGTPSPDAATVVPGDGIDLVTTNLLNLASNEPVDQRYSFVFDGNAQSLDHILINQELGAAAAGFSLDHARINADFPEINRNDANSPSRLADHDPAVAYFAVAMADLAVSASATPASVPVGGAMTFNATVSNLGPDAANFPGIGFAFDAELADLGVTAPSGWTCDAPVVGSGQTSVGCASMTTLADAGSAVFQLTATAPANETGNAINMSVVATSQTEDPDVDNNDASASVSVVLSSVDLSARLNTLARWYRPNDSIIIDIPLVNAGPDSAPQTMLVVRANVPSDMSAFFITMTPPAGWSCPRATSATFEVTCTRSTPVAAGSNQNFRVSMLIPASYTALIEMMVQASSAGTELTPANNVATRKLQRR
ncbi:MAG: lamin tail domain-containing protein [Lysobacter sp.]|nr:lamin tail domain-containing protein [Lysobacter sp.]